MINNNNDNNNVHGLVRGLVDQLTTPEDFLDGPLKDWATDFRAHTLKFRPVLDQISLRHGENNLNNFVNLQPHLDRVMLACSRKVQGNAPDDIHLNFTQEYVEEQLAHPHLDKRSSAYRGTVSQTVLKSMDLIEKYRYASVTRSKNQFFVDGDNGLIGGADWPDFYAHRVNDAILAAAQMDDNAKDEILTRAARRFLNGFEFRVYDYMYRQNFCFCWKLMVDSNKAIGGLVADQNLAMALGAATFIDIYPILKEPGMTAAFGKTLLDLEVGENRGHQVLTVCKATLQRCLTYGKRHALLFLTGTAIYGLRNYILNKIGAVQNFAHDVSTELDHSNNQPTGGFY